MNGTDDENSTPTPPGEHLKVPPIDPIAWAMLYGGLIDAARLEKAGLEYPDAPTGFMATEAALQAVVAFLQSCDGLMQESAVIPLNRLSVALRDLREGRSPPLLAPAPKNGRASTDHRRAMMIGMAARCLDELMESGERPDTSARTVSDALRKGGAVDAEAVTPTKIKNWRARCREGEPAISRGAISPDAWKHFREPLPPGMGDTPAQRAASLLKVLREASARGMGDRISQQPPIFPRNEQG